MVCFITTLDLGYHTYVARNKLILYLSFLEYGLPEIDH